MVNIKGNTTTLRAVEPSDVNLLYEWENQTEVWGVSGTITPFSHHTLSLFIEAQRVDIFTSKQMRFMICLNDGGEVVGALDIFEFDPLNHRAGVGIMIAPSFQRCGYAKDALMAVERYTIDFLRLHQIWCNVEEDNLASLKLFSSLGYKQVGIKQDWNSTPEGYKSEIMLQKLF